MIDLERYNTIRNRLIKLHSIITKRTYPVWVFPSYMMTTDEIRNRSEYKTEGVYQDGDPFEQPVLRRLKIPDIIKLLDNVSEGQPLRINDSHKNVIEIVESIQEYGSLWYELYVTKSNYGSINPKEIEHLEHLSFYLYGEYIKIRQYLDNKAHRKQVKDFGGAKNSLAGLMGLLSIDSKLGTGTAPEFVSYYDLLVSKVLPTYHTSLPGDYAIPAERSGDSLLRKEDARTQYGMWG